MNVRWLVAATAIMALGGCTSESSPAPLRQAKGQTDEFGLPLVIAIENIPDVPKEISEPSPPIAEKPQEPAKK
jgi:hypothetical protein